jgi:hypothetical protein
MQLQRSGPDSTAYRVQWQWSTAWQLIQVKCTLEPTAIRPDSCFRLVKIASCHARNFRLPHALRAYNTIQYDFHEF